MTIFRARSIVTMTRESPEAFVALGERIVATGPVADLRERFPGADVVDLGDSVIVPGFNDAHGHIGIVAEDALHLDLSWDSIRSLAELFEKFRAEKAKTRPGQWLRGSRYDDAKMAEGRVVTRWDLDEVSREHPIFVHQVAGHWCVVNSKALELAGVDDDVADPPGGRYDRDASGRLNGVLHETAMEIFWSHSTESSQPLLPTASLEDRLQGFRRTQSLFHASGITSLTDAFVQPHDLELFEEARKRGDLSMRLNMLVVHHAYEHVRKLGLRSGFGDERLRFGGVKAFVDGAIGGRTCLMEEPFEGTSDDHGIQRTSDSELRDIVRMVHLDGNRICVHANGDRAIRKLLDQLEAAWDERPQPGLRHRIEHCTIVTEDIVKRMSRLNAIAVPFGSYVYYHGAKLLDWYGPARIERMFAHRTFLDAGVGVAGSSDFPCGPYQPLLAMQSCVTRTGFDGTPLGLSQRITADEALALYTVGGAMASGEESVKGRLAPGYLADFVALDADPRTVDPSRIGSIAIRATFVGGALVSGSIDGRG
jgi:predicted amidohydrolase YtcJ